MNSSVFVFCIFARSVQHNLAVSKKARLNFSFCRRALTFWKASLRKTPLCAGDREPHTELNLATIVERHNIILKIYKILDETLSKMYFVQLSVASLELCVSMTSIISRSMELPELMFTVGFAFAAIFEILPICVLADQFQTLSEKLADAAYATNWPDQSFRFAILFIIHRSQNCRLILAGGIVPINLSDFSQYCAIRLLFLSNLYNDILIKI
ncbi:putative odorant receptor 59c isoform X2 [Hermetia illucens]|uniref:putative odorant receptor 59c isoform X2 n=1 Tax=Hermetia illucens TaxID=343691 RepID=UPI0018CC6280|nr:putative odorant receptor 59c isoform X2 [Hermetia illucens]